MIDPLTSPSRIAQSGLRTQSTRLKVISENIANVNSTGATPGSDPYARKTITFESAMSRAEGTALARVKSIGTDDRPFKVEILPGHPAADENGNVKVPNVDIILEAADMRDATRSYEANLQVLKQSREIVAMTLDLLKAG